MTKKWFALILTAVLLCAAILPASASETAEKPKDGTMIYEESFDHPDAATTDAVLKTLGWEAQTKAMGAYADPTASLALVGGRLQVKGSSDTYFLMLTEEQMAPYRNEIITIQYDMEYTTAANASRYFCILGNYNGQNYNSFHFRNGGYGNNQAHVAGSWITYDGVNPAIDAYSPAQDKDGLTSIAQKLLKQKYSGTQIFSKVPVTVRYVLDPYSGTAVYMKLADQPESAFVLVSVHDMSADGARTFGTWDANAICVKIGGQQDGYIDHIAVWVGDGNYPEPVAEEPVEETEPAETEPVEEPETPTEEPQETEPEQPKEPKEPTTIVNKIAIWATALFGGWILYKKGKEEDQK